MREGKLTPHPVGVYPQAIPRDPLSKLSAIPYGEAETLGYLKVDFLHLKAYDAFTTREEIETLVKLEPSWALLELPSSHPKLFQMSKHGDLLRMLKPKNIEELADAIALIRPGKKHLAGLYLKNKVQTRKLLYAKDEGGFSFKKSHALAYAYVISLQLHLIEQGKL